MVLAGIVAACLTSSDISQPMVQGRVRAADGAPIAGAEVTTMRYSAPRYVWTRAKTGADGTFQIQKSEVGYSIAVTYPGKGMQVIPHQGIDGKYEVVMPAPVVAWIRLLKPDGQPLANTEVKSKMVMQQSLGDWYPTLPDTNRPQPGVNTDAQGFAKLPGFSKGQSVEIVCPDERFTLDPTKKKVRAGLDQPKEFTLMPAYSITGRVTRDGKPVLGIDVNAMAQRGTSGDGDAWTDAEGRYTIKQLPAGIYNVELDLDNLTRLDWTALSAEAVKVGPKSPTPQVNIELIRGQELTVQVSDSTGSPVQGVNLQYNGLTHPESSAYGFTWRTDRTGVAKLRVAPGESRVWAVDSGDMKKVVVADQPATVRLTIQKKMDVALSGMVVDEDQKPVAKAEVRVHTADRNRGWSATSDSAGRFQVKADMPGPYVVSARSPVAWTPKFVAFSGKGSDKVVIKAQPVKQVVGRVVDDNGKPVKNADVMATVGKPGKVSFFVNTKTDATGRYTLDAMFDGPPIAVSARKDGFATARLDQPVRASEPVPELLLLNLDRSVSGTVLDADGKPVVGATVYCSNGNSDQRVMTDANGRFDHPYVPRKVAKLVAYKDNMIGLAETSDYSKQIVIKFENRKEDMSAYEGMPPTVVVGQQAPELVGSEPQINGPAPKLADLRGKVAVLQFWGTWCTPCVAEIPGLVAFHHAFPQVALVGIHAEKVKGNLSSFVEQKGITWPVFVDSDHKGRPLATSFAYGIRGFPTLVVLDREGKVVSVSHDVEDMQEAVEMVLVKDPEPIATIDPLKAGEPALVAVGPKPPALVTSEIYVNGPPPTLAELKGKIVLIQFWATWCGPCLEEIPFLVSLRKELPEAEVKFVGVHDRAISQVALARFVKEKEMTWPIFVDGIFREAAIATHYRYGIIGIPTLVVLDRTGQVAVVCHGVDEASESIKALLKKS